MGLQSRRTLGEVAFLAAIVPGTRSKSLEPPDSGSLSMLSVVDDHEAHRRPWSAGWPGEISLGQLTNLNHKLYVLMTTAHQL